jgi:hypothetical protein
MANQELAEKLAQLIRGYRKGEIAELNVDHVQRWISQFAANKQDALLTELTHVLETTYIAKAEIGKFLTGLTKNEKLTGDDPAAFWRSANFLRLQTAGNSQKDMLELFDAALKKAHGFGFDECGSKEAQFVYLDDALYSGGRIKSDISRWIKDAAPKRAKVAVIAVGIHCLGEWFAGNDITKAAHEVGKDIQIEWWRAVTFEDRKAYMYSSDVLRPTGIPDEAKDYVDSLGAEPILRTPGSTGKLGLFSSDEARILLEQEFLKAGVRVREMCPYLNKYMRPLGCTLMKTTGFGSLLVTYRNCANNAPLTLWAGDPWYPLFPRKTN